MALKKGGTLSYVHQDHLGSTALTTDSAGNTVSGLGYFPYGSTRSSSGTVPTDRRFTGQRLGNPVNLYFYNARYYDAGLGRFISPDTIVPDLANPQALNRYSYAVNNPLRYTDPSGHCHGWFGGIFSQGAVGDFCRRLDNSADKLSQAPQRLTEDAKEKLRDIEEAVVPDQGVQGVRAELGLSVVVQGSVQVAAVVDSEGTVAIQLSVGFAGTEVDPISWTEWRPN